MGVPNIFPWHCPSYWCELLSLVISFLCWLPHKNHLLCTKRQLITNSVVSVVQLCWKWATLLVTQQYNKEMLLLIYTFMGWRGIMVRFFLFISHYFHENAKTITTMCHQTSFLFSLLRFNRVSVKIIIWCTLPLLKAISTSEFPLCNFYLSRFESPDFRIHPNLTEGLVQCPSFSKIW